MTSDHKNPGVTIWATVVMVAVLVGYSLSVGPAIWIRDRTGGTIDKYFEGLYSPIIRASEDGPKPVPDAIGWYAQIWEQD